MTNYCNNGLNTNSQIGFMKAINVAKKGSVPVAENERDYRWVDIAELVAKYQIKGGVSSRNCKEITEWVPSSCGCGKKMQTRTICQECGCLPPTPECEQGIPMVLNEYEELLRVKFPKETIQITKIIVDGEEAKPSGDINSNQKLEEYFKDILGIASKIDYVNGKLYVVTEKKLGVFEYSLNGDNNHALFNLKDTKTIQFGANNLYLFEAVCGSNGRWVKYELPEFCAKDICFDGGEEKNVQQIIEKLIEKIRDLENNGGTSTEKITEIVDKQIDKKLEEYSTTLCDKVANCRHIPGPDAPPLEVTGLRYYEIENASGLLFTSGTTSQYVKLSHFEELQFTENEVKTITHDLLSKKISVTVYDANGEQVSAIVKNRTDTTVDVVVTETGTYEVVIKK